MPTRPLPIANEPPLADHLGLRTSPTADALTQRFDAERGAAWRRLARAHRYRLTAGEPGLCEVRRNNAGTLGVPGGMSQRPPSREHHRRDDPDMPWHLNAFRVCYQLQERPRPPEALLVTAAEHRYRQRSSLRLRRQHPGM